MQMARNLSYVLAICQKNGYMFVNIGLNYVSPDPLSKGIVHAKLDIMSSFTCQSNPL